MRAAPAQISAWGYVAGPGTPGIDYLLTDNIIVPPDEDRWFGERLMRLGCAQPYNADLLARRPSASLGARSGGGIRFGCFNRYDKLNEESLTCWAEILRACPDATLILKDRNFGEARLRKKVLDIMAREGVAPGRLGFEGAEKHMDFLAAFDRIDLALDPFPVTGGVTTLDGLSQGVPVVTFCGNEPSARIGASILSSLELNRFIAFSEGEYVSKAIELGAAQAHAPGARDAIRARLEKFSDWCGGEYVREVEGAYREIWMRTCARQAGRVE
jgi:predicted O-linked N-acetylglucosamine transferase (SPINDLY family)